MNMDSKNNIEDGNTEANLIDDTVSDNENNESVINRGDDAAAIQTEDPANPPAAVGAEHSEDLGTPQRSAETVSLDPNLDNLPQTPHNATVSAVAAPRGSSALPKALAVIGVLLLIGVGLVVWKTKFAPHHDEVLTHISKEDMQLLLKDASPMQLKSIAASPEQKKKVAESLRQLLAVASQAKKEGIAEDPNVKRELESIRSLITASLYDKKINEGKPQMPPFSFITEDQVKEFWSGGDAARHEAEFKEFLDAKIALARESGKFPKDKELEEEEIKQAKDDFAKVKIYE